MKYYLAIDIGASSGRHIIGHYENEQLILEEIYRFPNGVINQNNHLIWDIDNLFLNIKKGIKLCLEKYSQIESLAIDTWGCDYVLMNKDQVIYPCYAYRDNRTNSIIDEVHKRISFEKLYNISGSQFQNFNTIYQLYEDKVSGRLKKADSFLMIPEYLTYKLTGIKMKEFTNAGTTGLYDINTLKVSQEIIDKLQFPEFVKEKVYKPSTLVGDLKEDIIQEVGGNIKVKLCCSHDTASAIECLKMDDEIYISSGTWSLLGIKTKTPITTLKAQQANYSNEFGPNYIRFQKNIMGLWIIQNLSKELSLSFTDMVSLASLSKYNELIDVNDECFKAPKDMKKEIISYLSNRKMILPKNNADLINLVYHSLAFSYQQAIEELEEITNKKFKKIYIVGGGAKNKYLNELTKFYTQKEVIALPIEATSIGNLMMQMEEKNESRS